MLHYIKIKDKSALWCTYKSDVRYGFCHLINMRRLTNKILHLTPKISANTQIGISLTRSIKVVS
jgi:hypothetical protein